jgi:hypothetical protein
LREAGAGGAYRPPGDFIAGMKQKKKEEYMESPRRLSAGRSAPFLEPANARYFCW